MDLKIQNIMGSKKIIIFSKVLCLILILTLKYMTNSW